MALYRVKTRWTGFTGSPGYTILHFSAPTEPTLTRAQEVHGAVQTFMSGISSYLPSAARLTVETGVEIINETNGMLENVFTVTAGTAISGTVTGGFSSATGACINWNTTEVRNGRRVRGRSFIVPLAATMYDTDGTLTPTVLAGLQGRADTLVGGGWDLQVFKRPTVKGATDGDAATVVSARIADKTAILRSRRD